LVVSEVLEGSPADKAGLRERDIILTFDGKALPLYKPDRVVAAYLDREIDGRKPGDRVKLGVLRGDQRVEIVAALEDAPTLPREAERRYFDYIGLTVRAFTYADGAVRRAKLAEHRGVIAHFVKANAPVSAAGLRIDDWIKEIDGVAVTDFASAVTRLEAIEADRARSEFVLLVDRGGETAVLRVKLK
jgi:serine protease Do